jgi:aminopeptidase YwaD
MENIKELRIESLRITDHIIKEKGPRLAGTKACLESADLLVDEMNTFTNQVTKESFFLHQGAFLGWIKILVASYLFGVIFLWLNMPLIALILAIMSILILVFQFFFYKPVIDFLYPKKTGYNVIGKIEPKGKVERQVIISGHHDSAKVFNFFIYQPKLYNLRVTGGIALMIALVVLSLFLVFVQIDLITLIVKIFLSLGFLLTGQLWFFESRKASPGAGDNLIASAMAISLGKYFSKHRLNKTRLIIASFDAEEEGLRGARAYAKKHKDELKEIPTYLLNVDCPYYLKDIFFLTSDINTTVNLSEDLAKELVEIAHEKGYPAVYKKIEFLTGGTDAGELAKVGVFATTLMAMPWSNNERASVYHTPNDTIDAIEIEAIDATLDIFKTYIEKNDF